MAIELSETHGLALEFGLVTYGLGLDDFKISGLGLGHGERGHGFGFGLATMGLDYTSDGNSINSRSSSDVALLFLSESASFCLSAFWHPFHYLTSESVFFRSMHVVQPS